MEAHGELRKDMFSEEKAFQEVGGHQPSPSRRHRTQECEGDLDRDQCCAVDSRAKEKRGDEVTELTVEETP